MEETADILRAIAAGEDTFLELKEVVFKENQIRFGREEGRAQAVIAEVFVSMANTEGGTVLFGVRNQGEIVGIDPARRDLLEQFVVNLSQQSCTPAIDPLLDWLLLPDASGVLRLCLKVTIPKARYYVHSTSDGRYLKRVGSHRTLIPAEQLGRLLAARRLAVPAEERPAFGTTVKDLDRQRFGAYYERRFEAPLDEAGVDFEQLLLNQKLALQGDDGIVRATVLGVLLFTSRPDRFLSGAYVDLAAYEGDVADGNTLDSRQIYGPIPEQIAQILQYFGASPLLPIRSVKDESGRLDLPSYSRIALQEAVVNALVHRDYELIGSQVRIFLFPGRIEIWSPGTLHNSLIPEDLYRGCQPIRRNQLLAGFLRDFISPVTQRSYMEARGEGFLRLVRESEKISGRRPELEVVGEAVRLTLYAAA